MRQHHRNIAFRPPPRQYDETGESSFSMAMRFLRRYLYPHRRSLALCMLVSSLGASSFYLTAYYARYVVDHILIITPAADNAAAPVPGTARAEGNDAFLPDHDQARAGNSRNREKAWPESRGAPGAGARLAWLFVLYASTMTALNILARLSQRTRIAIDRKITGRLREDLHHKVLALSLAYHKIQTPGRLLSRIVSDVDVIQSQLAPFFMSASHSLVMMLFGVAILAAADWRILVFLLFVFPLYSRIYLRYRLRIKDLNRELRHTNSCMYGYVSQKLDGIKAIQAYARERLEMLSFHRLAACFFRDAYSQNDMSGRLNCLAQIVAGLATGAVFVYCAHLVLSGRMTIGKMMYVYGVTATLFGPVLNMTQLGVIYNNLLVVIHRVMEVLDEPVVITDAPDAVAFPSPLRRGIVMRDVGFKYSAQGGVGRVISGITLEAPVGTSLCIMGPSGAGKTTLLYLLTRLYEPTEGEILFDGVPIAKIRLVSFRDCVGFVPQEAQIFGGTVRDNICYGRPGAEPSQIMASSQAAQLHDFIMDMPVQYETIIGEKGVSLSGGQRQRLSLARALLTNPDVLVLDDCTSALDADTERKIQETLAGIMKGKTSIVVSQRVSMASRCDRICTLENGRITESGTHAELAHAGGFYSRLLARQTTF